MANEKHSFVKGIFVKFFVPSLLSFLGLAVGGVADCLFIGNQIGEQGLAVISFASPIYLFFSLISSGISIGASILYSNVIANGDEQKGNSIFTNTVLFTFMFNIIIVAMGLIFRKQLINILGVSVSDESYSMIYKYITWQLICSVILFMQEPFYYFVHCDNAPKLSAIALVIANIVDILFNYIFVVILNVGVIGSVISTVLGAIVCIVICLYHILSKKTSLRFVKVKLDLSVFFESVKIGFATATGYLYQFIIVLMFNNILMNIAGTSGVAIFDVVYNISLLTTAIFEGLSGTMQPMISTFYGERNKENINAVLKLSFKYGFISIIVCILILGGFAELYCPIFGLDEGEILNSGTIAIRLYLLSLIPAVFNNIVTYYFQSIERERKSYYICIFRSFVFLGIFGLLFAQKGINNFWLCYLFAEFSTTIVTLIYCLIFKRSIQLNFIENVFSGFLIKGENSNSDKIEKLQEFCQSNGLSYKDSYFLTLAVDEICQTIFSYNEYENNIYVQLTLVMSNNEYILHMRDNKKDSFNPFDINIQNSSIEDENSNIIGMKIVKSKAKESFYRNYIGYNTLTIKF